MKSIAIIGASYLQLPLVRRAKELGLRTVCFAWEDGAVCRDVASKFYPISIVDKEKILEVCREEKIDGVTSIASDVAVPTIAYVAHHLGLIGNSEESAKKSTNKYLMRQAFQRAGVSIPRFVVVDAKTRIALMAQPISFPQIVKPVDRSGSMGVMKVRNDQELAWAVDKALSDSLCGQAIVEDCIEDMREVSVEGISWNGEYHLLAMTDKVTTAAPHYVELGHHQPADLSDDLRSLIESEVRKGVAALDIRYGASHSELMITGDGRVYMTEIGARMGGDFIGSHLVQLSTGYDFLEGVIRCALGNFDGVKFGRHVANSGVWFYAPQTRWVKEKIVNATGDPRIIESELLRDEAIELTRSADRSGYFIYQSSNGRYHAPIEG